MLRLVTASALGCALALAPLHARAQTSSASTQHDTDRRARAEFTAGRDAYSHGDYAEAARRFENAYQLSQRRELLFNIGTAYERLHRWEPARDAFQQYLEAFPNAPERDELRGRLTVIESEIEREHHRVAPSPAPSAAPVERVVIREVPVETHPMRTAAIVVGSLGVISLAASLTIGLITNGYYEELVNSCGQTEAGCGQPVIDDVQLRSTLVNVFAIGGGVLVAGAAVLFVLDVTRPHHEAPAHRATGWRSWHFGLAPSSQGGSFVWTGAF